MTELENTIVRTAENWIGEEEIRGNLGFKEMDFQDIMQSVGWKKRQAWCVYFIKLVWLMAFVHEPKKVRKLLNVIMNGSAVASYASFKKSDFLVDALARPGALVFWQEYSNGIPSWMGHSGIVVESLLGRFATIEGNTNPNGGREGFVVWPKKRNFTWSTNNGLRLLGFVHPEYID